MDNKTSPGSDSFYVVQAKNSENDSNSAHSWDLACLGSFISFFVD